MCFCTGYTLCKYRYSFDDSEISNACVMSWRNVKNFSEIIDRTRKTFDRSKPMFTQDMGWYGLHKKFVRFDEFGCCLFFEQCYVHCHFLLFQ